MKKVLGSLMLIALLIIGCKQTKRDTNGSSETGQAQLEDPIIVSYGKHSGFNESYSSWEVRVTTDSVICMRVPTKVSNDTIKPFTKRRTLRESERERLLSNLKEFYMLPTRIGCPGCDDGPVQWLKIRANYYTKTVYMQQDSTVQSLKDLIEELDKLDCDQ